MSHFAAQGGSQTRTRLIGILASVAAVAAWVIGCPPAAPSGPGPADTGTPARDTSGADSAATPISADNFTQVAERLDATLLNAVQTAVAQLSDAGLRANSRSRIIAQSSRVLAEEIDPLVVAGAVGSVEISGTRLLQRWPPRYELTFAFTGYGADEKLKLDGGLDYNFVLDDSVDPPLPYGLYRGSVQIGGEFEGALELSASIAAGRTSAVRATSAAGELSSGPDAPPAFVTYVSTLAGTGQAGFKDGAGAAAMFDSPTGVTVDEDGHVYVADQGNGAIREIDLEGEVSTVSDVLQYPYDLGFDSLGLLVVSDQLGGSHGNDETPLLRLVVHGDARGLITPIVKGTENYPGSVFPLCPITEYACDGRSPLSAMPWATGIDVQNLSVLVAEWALRPSLRLVLPDGYSMTMLDLDAPESSVCDEDHSGAPRDLALGNHGEIYFTSGCHVVRVFETDGRVRTLAGHPQTTLEFADGVGDEARFAYPEGLVFDGERYLYVADASNSLIRRVDVETGEAVRVAGCLAHTEGFDCTDGFGFVDGPGDSALFDSPYNVAIDRWGDLYVADQRNHAIRFIRIVSDPERAPSVHRFDPAVIQQGQSAKLTISGRNLATVRSIDIGDGVTVTVEQAGYQRVTAHVDIAADAAPGPRPLALTTAYGTLTTPDDLSFTVLSDHRGGAQVETIAGTGGAELDQLNYGAAQNTTFAFPGGMHAISADRLLVADPLEQRIRLIATRVGAVEEFFELLVYAATGSDVDVLGGIIGVFDTIEKSLDFFGISSGIVGQTEDALRDVAEKAVDEICATVGPECHWLSLPWAGTPYVPGEHNGFRLESTFFLPTDIWYAGNRRFYIADSGNGTIRVVGYDIEQQQEAPMQVFSSDEQPDFPYAVTPMGTSIFASLPSSMLVSQMSESSGAVNADYASIPRGVPLGMASGGTDSSSDDRSIFAADPLNATIWRIVDQGGVSEVRDIRGDIPSFVIGKCVDGPATFATWGAPMDVAVDQTGTIYVADCGCNSIRVIKDAGFGTDLDGLVGELRSFVASNQSRISAAAAQAIEENLRQFNTEFLDANRFWVTTLAGSPDGEAGYADGPAALARFNAPTAVAVASTGEATVVFVADTGNRRIRRIVVP